MRVPSLKRKTLDNLFCDSKINANLQQLTTNLDSFNSEKNSGRSYRGHLSVWKMFSFNTRTSNGDLCHIGMFVTREIYQNLHYK